MQVIVVIIDYWLYYMMIMSITIVLNMMWLIVLSRLG